MIRLTRLNGQPLVLNSGLIKFIEQAPDTVITLVSGEEVIVREQADEVVNLVREFRRSVLRDNAGVDGDPQIASEHDAPGAARSHAGR